MLGSLFILAIAAAAGLRPTIRGLSHDIILRINYLLRCPNPGMLSTYATHIHTEYIALADHPLGKMIIQDIIPAISLLRQQFRITFSTLFSQSLLLSRGVIPEIEAGDFERSDEFFNSITFK